MHSIIKVDPNGFNPKIHPVPSDEDTVNFQLKFLESYIEALKEKKDIIAFSKLPVEEIRAFLLSKKQADANV